jgi:hypothetical protein
VCESREAAYHCNEIVEAYDPFARSDRTLRAPLNKPQLDLNAR